MQASRFAPLLRRAHYQLRADCEIAQLQRVRRDEIAKVVVSYLAAERLDPITKYINTPIGQNMAKVKSGFLRRYTYQPASIA